MENRNKVITFIKNNAFYIVLGLCIVAIGLSLTLIFTVGTTRKNVTFVNDVIEGDAGGTTDVSGETDVVAPAGPTEPVKTVVEFVAPVNGEIIKDYTDTVCFNQTLNRYEKHQAIDYLAESGADVVAVYDGTVESVTASITKGVTIVVNHGDGLKSIYNSLEDGNEVWVGKSVLQGDVIGKVSATNRQEYKDGAHLHFEVTLNDENVNPSVYFMTEENK